MSQGGMAVVNTGFLFLEDPASLEVTTFFIESQIILDLKLSEKHEKKIIHKSNMHTSDLRK